MTSNRITVIRTLVKRTWRERLCTFPWNPFRTQKVVLENVEEDAWREQFTKPAVWRKRPFDSYRARPLPSRLREPVRPSEPAPFLGGFNPFPLPYSTDPQRTLGLVDNNSIMSGGGGAFDGGGASGRWEAPTVTEHAKTEPMSYVATESSCSNSSSDSSSSYSSSSDSSSSSSSDSSSSCSSSSDF